MTIMKNLRRCAALAASVLMLQTALWAAPKVTVTVFPVYDWILQIAGSRRGSLELSLLYDTGVDMHSYQPTADDVVKIASSDLFVCVGGLSDQAALRASSSAAGGRERVELLKEFGAAARTEHHEDEKEGEHHRHEGHHDHEQDEHVWLSLKNAGFFTGLLAERLAALDPEGAEIYRANAESYRQKLKALDGAYRAAVEQAPFRAVLFADRFPFLYLMEDYGLEHYAAFSGCSAESEASFRTIATLAERLKTLKLPAVLTLEQSDRKLAETVKRTGGSACPILSMDSLQSYRADDANRGVSYLSVMEKNLGVLKQALGVAE